MKYDGIYLIILSLPIITIYIYNTLYKGTYQTVQGLCKSEVKNSSFVSVWNPSVKDKKVQLLSFTTTRYKS
jgi:hypothetical protein